MATQNPPQSPSQNLITRRRFVYSSALAAGAVTVPIPAGAARARYRSPNEKLSIAVIGAGGKGAGDTDPCAATGVGILALFAVETHPFTGGERTYSPGKSF